MIQLQKSLAESVMEIQNVVLRQLPIQEMMRTGQEMIWLQPIFMDLAVWHMQMIYLRKKLQKNGFVRHSPVMKKL